MSSVTGQAHGMGAAHSSARSAPVSAATTPGIASGRRRCRSSVMRAWAMRAAHQRQLQRAGDDEVVDEAGLAGEQRRVLLAHAVRVPMTAVAIDGGHRRSPPARAAGEHRLDDVVVAGAAAEVALEALAHLGLGRVRVLVEQRDRRHDHARRAEAALQAVVLLERLLHRVQLAVGGQALDGGDLGAVGLDGEHRARLHRLAVEQHGARAARRRVAADVGAGEPERRRGGSARAAGGARRRAVAPLPLTVMETCTLAPLVRRRAFGAIMSCTYTAQNTLAALFF